MQPPPPLRTRMELGRHSKQVVLAVAEPSWYAPPTLLMLLISSILVQSTLRKQDGLDSKRNLTT